jgi:hypothetical protein
MLYLSYAEMPSVQGALELLKLLDPAPVAAEEVRT